MNVAYLTKLHHGCAAPVLPVRYATATLETLPPHLREVCQSYLQHFTAAASLGVAPLFLGRARSWKTAAACVLAREVWRQYSLPVTFVSMPSALLEIDWDRFSAETRKRVAAWSTCPFLILDDFGVVKPQSVGHATLQSVLAARFDACLPTVLTGNVDVDPSKQLEEMTTQYGVMLTRRLQDASAGYLVLSD